MAVTHETKGTPMPDLAAFEQAKRDLDDRTDQLAVIADWQDDLRARIARALLRFELIGLDEHEQDALADEVESFKRVCRCLAWCRRTAA